MAFGAGKFGKAAGAAGGASKAAPAKLGAGKPAAAAKGEVVVGKFGKSAGASSGGGRLSWTGSGSEKEPMLGLGGYLLRVLSTGVNIKPKGAPNAGRKSFKAVLEVVDADEGAESGPGKYCAVFVLSTDAGCNETCRFVRTAAGFDTDDAFGEMVSEYADGDAELGANMFMNACDGEANAFGENGSPVVGRLVRVNVQRGKPVAEGSDDYYRNYQWTAVADDEQVSA
jgi:hypothetical protein